jgi:hypothetical protein
MEAAVLLFMLSISLSGAPKREWLRSRVPSGNYKIGKVTDL